MNMERNPGRKDFLILSGHCESSWTQSPGSTGYGIHRSMSTFPLIFSLQTHKVSTCELNSTGRWLEHRIPYHILPPSIKQTPHVSYFALCSYETNSRNENPLELRYSGWNDRRYPTVTSCRVMGIMMESMLFDIASITSIQHSMVPILNALAHFFFGYWTTAGNCRYYVSHIT